MSYKLVIAEKPSVAQSIAKVIGADKREDGYLQGNGYIVSWCVGHLVELASPESYKEAKKSYSVVYRVNDADGTEHQKSEGYTMLKEA